MLDEKGMPTPVEIAYIYPPKSQLAPLATGERDSLVKQDDLYHHYSQYVDNESAFELLNAKAEAIKAEQAAQKKQTMTSLAVFSLPFLARRRKKINRLPNKWLAKWRIQLAEIYATKSPNKLCVVF
ncbi:Bacterial protein of uncharacterised function (DUF853) [Mannheimia haemolytica]|uniref:Bacterial protein of uncharacterized function (DUF853) n=1 Tax=Mannheimia haemolytica TaxID=75985 RepID=A0A378N710_MANHA|nr:Bacterial protein of uncharacterised function (DUF853) [Mannheimia haemolytica]